MKPQGSPAAARAETVRWVAGIGVATAEALAVRDDTSLASARARLRSLVTHRLLSHARPLTDGPRLYAVTRAGLRASGSDVHEPCRISAAGAAHAAQSALVAASLQRLYPRCVVIGEPELRLRERHAGRPVASVPLHAGPGGPRQHRPDLVLLAPPPARPIAVELEMTVKSPARLAAICSSWARARHLGGVLYLAAPAVVRPLSRAIERAQAGSFIAVLPLAALDASSAAAPSAAGCAGIGSERARALSSPLAGTRMWRNW